MATKPEQTTTTRREGRSPAYPFFSVEKALVRTRQLWEQERSHWAPLVSAMAAWGYSTKSSGGRQTLASMKYYALIEVTGEGDGRNIRVSDLAKRILLDEREDDSERQALIREVALSPSAHRTIFEKYKDEGRLPSDSTVEYFLVWEKGFNKDAARDLLAEFKETASYVGLFEPEKDVDKTPLKEDDDRTPPKVKVGDIVQATVHGQNMFQDGARVLGFSEDGAWVFVDKAKGGVKLEEITVLEAAQTPLAQERPTIPASLLQSNEDREPAGRRKAVFPLDEGDVTLTFPEGMSKEGLTDLSDYLDIFLKKEKAKAKPGS